MKKIRTNAVQILQENYQVVEEKETISISDYAKIESESDPDFYRWLFNDHDIADFGSDLSDDEKKIAADFFETL